MEDKKVIKLLEEIRGLLKENQSKYNIYLKSSAEMYHKYQRKNMYIAIVILTVTFLLFIFLSILPN